MSSTSRREHRAPRRAWSSAGSLALVVVAVVSDYGGGETSELPLRHDFAGCNDFIDKVAADSVG